MERNIQLLAIDLDGTTVHPNNTISERVLATVAAARATGLRIVIATGRNSVGASHYAARFGLDGPVIAQQGGLIYDHPTNVVLHRLRLPHDLACELVAYEIANPHWHTVIYQDEHVFVTNGDYFAHRDGLVGWNPVIVPDLCNVLDSRDPDKILFMLDEHLTHGVLREVTAIVGERALVVQSHAQFVEVNPLGADKGTALSWLAGRLGIARDNVMAIGDQHNDSSMLAWAGVSVAMGNAREDIKALAGWVAPSIDDDGAAVAIEKYVLS